MISASLAVEGAPRGLGLPVPGHHRLPPTAMHHSALPYAPYHSQSANNSPSTQESSTSNWNTRGETHAQVPLRQVRTPNMTNNSTFKAPAGQGVQGAVQGSVQGSASTEKRVDEFARPLPKGYNNVKYNSQVIGHINGAQRWISPRAIKFQPSDNTPVNLTQPKDNNSNTTASTSTYPPMLATFAMETNPYTTPQNTHNVPAPYSGGPYGTLSQEAGQFAGVRPAHLGTMGYSIPFTPRGKSVYFANSVASPGSPVAQGSPNSQTSTGTGNLSQFFAVGGQQAPSQLRLVATQLPNAMNTTKAEYGATNKLGAVRKVHVTSTFTPSSAIKEVPETPLPLVKDRPDRTSSDNFKVPCGKEGSLKHRILTRPPSQPPAGACSSAGGGTSSVSSALSVCSASSVSVSDSTKETKKKRVTFQVASPPKPPPRVHNEVKMDPLRGDPKMLVPSGESRPIGEFHLTDLLKNEQFSRYRLIEGLVMRIEESPSDDTARVYVLLAHFKSLVRIQSTMLHPFFSVTHDAWVSCAPERSVQYVKSKCERMRVGDKIVVMVPRTQLPKMAVAQTQTCDISSSTKKSCNTITTSSTNTVMTSHLIQKDSTTTTTSVVAPPHVITSAIVNDQVNTTAVSNHTTDVTASNSLVRFPDTRAIATGESRNVTDNRILVRCNSERQPAHPPKSDTRGTTTAQALPANAYYLTKDNNNYIVAAVTPQMNASKSQVVFQTSGNQVYTAANQLQERYAQSRVGSTAGTTTSTQFTSSQSIQQNIQQRNHQDIQQGIHQTTQQNQQTMQHGSHQRMQQGTQQQIPLQQTTFPPTLHIQPMNFSTKNYVTAVPAAKFDLSKLPVGFHALPNADSMATRVVHKDGFLVPQSGGAVSATMSTIPLALSKNLNFKSPSNNVVHIANQMPGNFATKVNNAQVFQVYTPTNPSQQHASSFVPPSATRMETSRCESSQNQNEHNERKRHWPSENTNTVNSLNHVYSNHMLAKRPKE